MPLRLKNAPPHVYVPHQWNLSAYVGDFYEVYLDDTLIYSKDYKYHLVHLAKVQEVSEGAWIGMPVEEM